MGTAIVITSGKGGTGKTTTTAALAICLALTDSRVLCIDADAGLKNLDLQLGLLDGSVFDYGDVIAGRCSVEDAVSPHPNIPGLFLLSAPIDTDVCGLPQLVGRLKADYDYCLIDCPAGIGQAFREACAGADSAIVVSYSDLSSCRDCGRVVQELNTLGIYNIRLIINRVRRGVLRSVGSTLDDTVDSIGARLIGYVPEDKNVIVSSMLASPFLLSSTGGATAAYTRIAKRIRGQKAPLKSR